MVCPLCEHVQEQGDSCDQCGMRLVADSPAPIQVEQFPDLEPTQVAPIGNIPILPLLRLERGREASTVDPRTRQADIDASEEEEVAARCPNCGLPGRLGGRCAPCGVRLMKVEL
jgi:methionyl-tRNA synthetase